MPAKPGTKPKGKSGKPKPKGEAKIGLPRTLIKTGKPRPFNRSHIHLVQTGKGTDLEQFTSTSLWWDTGALTTVFDEREAFAKHVGGFQDKLLVESRAQLNFVLEMVFQEGMHVCRHVLGLTPTAARSFQKHWEKHCNILCNAIPQHGAEEIRDDVADLLEQHPQMDEVDELDAYVVATAVLLSTGAKWQLPVYVVTLDADLHWGLKKYTENLRIINLGFGFCPNCCCKGHGLQDCPYETA
eukprot:TRINITY_DN67355_c2_g2_i3.p1 TRINITY_DN67355_c2_g2~~TRINITY_DN67355_c2_g2_i3.p1  ORF type:complete len:241 (-),score=10.90 TRINITY_DN67355_c2_g2_i3:191-913(-)